MDNHNALMMELLAEEAARERQARPAQPTVPSRTGHGMRSALAGRLVRLGLRLDPAAGEALGAAPLPQLSRRQAA